MHSLAKFVSQFAGKRRSAEAGVVVSSDVIASDHPDGVVFLHIGRGAVFTSNRMGARIWRGLADRQPLGSIAAAIAAEYGVEPERVERDARSFLADLQLRGFVQGSN